jgi:hypothetical protein
MTPLNRKRLQDLRRFQKTLALHGRATSAGEAEAAERAARRLMEVFNIDPVTLTNNSLYDYVSLADNSLLATLRAEYRAAHPDFHYSKPDASGNVRRLLRKPRPPKPPKPVDHQVFDGLFEGLDDVFSIQDQGPPMH